MQPVDLFTFLRHTLSPADAPMILLAIKTDKLVWDTLQQGDLFRSGSLDDDPENWAPANLALLALGARTSAKDLGSDHLPGIDSGLRRKSLERFERLLRKGEKAETLADAGLIALALRERRRKMQSWEGLVDELKVAGLDNAEDQVDCWQTPLACLAGMVPDPYELYAALLSKEQLKPGMEWVTHMVLSTPAVSEDQTAILKKLMLELPLDYQVEWLRHLVLLGRASLATPLANDLLIENREYLDFLGKDADPDQCTWAELSQKALGFEVLGSFHQLAGHPLQSAAALEKSRRLLHHWVSGTSLQLASLAAKEGRLTEDIWEDCVAVTEALPVSENLMSEMYLLGGEKLHPAILSGAITSKTPVLGQIFTAAQQANTRGKHEAQETAREAVQYWLTQVKRDPSILSGKYVLDFPVAPILQVLVDLGLLKEAISVGKAYLNARPGDSALMLQVAEICHRVGNYSEASDLVIQAILLNPSETRPRRILAGYLEESEAWREALDERKQILEVSPLPPLDDSLALARCALGAKKFEDALQVCDQILAIDGELGMAYTYAGMAQAGLENHEEALKDLSKATLLTPENPNPWIQLAALHRKNGDNQRALETLRTAILTAPDSAELHFELGRAYLENNLASEALPFLRQSARLAPESDEVALALTETLLSLGHENEALDVLEKARAKWPVHPGLAYQHARLLLARGERDEGLATLEIALQSEKAEPEWYALFASSLMGKPESQWRAVRPVDFNQLVKAQKALQRSLNIQPECLETRVLMAELLALRQDYEAAYAAYDHLVQNEQASSEDYAWRIQAGLGNVALNLGHHSIALAAFKNAVGARPDSIILQRKLAETFETLKLSESACQTADDALMLAPDAIDNLLWYGDIMGRLGENEKGIQALKTAAQIAPQRVNIITSLANLYYNLGDRPGSEAVLMQAMTMETASSDDLLKAAEIARKLENDDLTLAALEKAASVNPEPSANLEYELARMYAQTHRVDKAIVSIQRAIDIHPEEEPYYLLQSDLQCELNRPQAALASLEHALRLHESREVEKNLDENIAGMDEGLFDIHLRFARLLEKTTNLSSALYHAEKAAQLGSKSSEARYQATELSYRLLQTDRAEKILNETGPNETTGFRADGSKKADLQWNLALQTLAMEFAFNHGDLATAKKIIEKGLLARPDDRNLMAGQIRVLAAQNDYAQAEQLYAQLRDDIAADQAASTNEQTVKIGSLLLAQAAADLFLWDDAFELWDAYLKQHPQEPLALFTMAKGLVSAGEWQLASEPLGVTRHIYPASLVNAENQGRFELLLADLEKLAGGAEVERWKARGNILFQPTTANVRVLEGLRVSDKEIPWIVLGLTRAGNPAGAIQVAEKYAHVAPALSQELQVQADRDTQKAFECAKRAVLQAPGNPLCQANLAKAAQAINEPAQALEAIEASLAQWQDEPEWHFLAAGLAEQCQDGETAILHLESANELDPGNLTYLTELGNKYLQFRMADKAAEVFNQLSQISPEAEKCWVLLARSQFLAGNYPEAQQAIDRALELNERSAPALVLNGEIALRAGDDAKALELVHAAQKIAPADPDNRLLAARILIKRGKDKDALGELTQAVVDIPNSIELGLERAKLIYRMNGATAAFPVLQKLAGQHPQDDRLLALLAKAAVEVGDKGQAEKAGIASLKINPRQPELNYLLGKVYHLTGQLDKAVYHLSEAALTADEKAEIFLELGKAYSDRREYARSLEAYQHAVQAAPDDSRTYYQCAVAMRDGKDYPGAEAMLRKAAQLAPDDVNIRRQLGAIVALNLVQTCQEANSCQ